MSTQGIPKKAVSELQNRLRKSVDSIGKEVLKNDPVISSFHEIQGKLEHLKTQLRTVDFWEDHTVAMFSELERSITDTISVARKQPSEADFQGIREKIKELEDALSRRQMSEDWMNLKMEEEILESSAMVNLSSSFHNLGPLEQRICFLFFSIFPEKAVIRKRPLIYWWISEGLIKTEQEGEHIFQELIDQGLIESHHDKPRPVVHACTMHPWYRYLAISLAKETALFDFDDRGTPSYSASRSRRACLVLNGQNSWVTNQDSSGFKEEDLLTVFNVSEKYYLDFKLNWLPKLKKVVVLQLGRWQNSLTHHIEVENEEFLNGLGPQKGLRYLSFRGISRITKLPSSVVKLFNLEIFDLRACHNLEELPSDIELLRKLTHLDVSDCPLLQGMPKGIQKLLALQVLKGFMIGTSRAAACRIADLVKLTHLRRLSIYIGSEAVVGVEDLKKLTQELGKLKEIGSLSSLTIWWGVKSLAQQDATTAISFPPQLEKLDLRGIPEQSPPQALNPTDLPKLKKLYIRGGVLRSLYTDESEKWGVECLRLKYLKNFNIQLEKLFAAFSDLRYLEVSGDIVSVEQKDLVLNSKDEIADCMGKLKKHENGKAKNEARAEGEGSTSNS